MTERNRNPNDLLNTETELPMVVDDNGRRELADILQRRHNNYIMEHMMGLRSNRESDDVLLSRALNCFPPNRRIDIYHAFWKVIEAVSRQGVLPRITEVDKVGRFVEQSRG